MVRIGYGVSDCLRLFVVPGVHGAWAHPNQGRMTWSATTMTSQAIGTAAKKPSAALQPLRRRTVPEPVGCGTTI